MASNTSPSASTLTTNTSLATNTSALHTLRKNILASTDSSLTSSLVTIPNHEDFNDSWMKSFNTEYTLSFCDDCEQQDNEIPEQISLSRTASITTHNFTPVEYYYETTKQWL